jgi:glycine/D-amino acid oxidase-like deaminating enzyme
MSAKRYIVIGSGVFGLSTVLHILPERNAKPDRRTDVTLISCPQPEAPTEDISKIIRVDYTSECRMKEAIRAQVCWKTDEIFEAFYQPVGRIVGYSEQRLQTLNTINETRSRLGLEKRKRQEKDVLEKYYGSIDVPEGLTYTYNEDDGLVEWAGCIQKVREVVRERCTMRDIQIQQLIHKEGQVVAVTFHNDDGINVEIDTKDKDVILAAGPWIGEILDRSGIEQPPKSKAPVAVGIFAFVLHLQEDQARRFRGAPIYSQIGQGTPGCV